MDALAAAAVADPQAARQLDRRRPGHRAQGQEAADPHRQAGPGGGRGADRRGAGRAPARRGHRGAGDRRGASLLKVRERLLDAATRTPIDAAGRAARPPARLPAPRPHLARRAHRARARCLPGRRHGPGQDGHPDRAAPAPRRGRSHRPDAGGLPGQPARQLGGRDPPVRARGRRTALPRRPARPRLELRRPASGFVLTTYGTMRVDHELLAPTSPGTSSSPTRPSTSRTRASSTARALRAIPSRGPGRAHRHPGREQPDRALGDPRLGHARAARQPQRLPQGVGRADRVRRRADQGRASSPT